jgi:1-aminocyclopropane-1-carboxylate deaminase/D-cysteine desulfhydrase-like pyridoxal-dependent ACC family enzyme
MKHASLFQVHTPLESHLVSGYSVWVKRDDLFAHPPAPPLGKLRGAIALIKKLREEGTDLVGCWDTRISALGQGIAAICAYQFPDVRVITCYPNSKGSTLPEPLRIAKMLGAEILPVRPGRITISFAEARREVQSRGGVMLPFGLDCLESVEAIALESRTVPPKAVNFGTVVVSCGSGVTLAGLVRGLGSRASHFVGVSSGRSVASIQRCLKRYGTPLEQITLVPPVVPYSRCIKAEVPFPSHPNYDEKAWAVLKNRIRSLKPPVLFWNVGAAATGSMMNSLSRKLEAKFGSNGPHHANQGLLKEQ